MTAVTVHVFATAKGDHDGQLHYDSRTCCLIALSACSQVAQTVAHIHGAMLQLGLRPGDHIGVIGANCPEWLMAMQASARPNARASWDRNAQEVL